MRRSGLGLTVNFLNFLMHAAQLLAYGAEEVDRLAYSTLQLTVQKRKP
jgi:hypothetical protein